MTYFDLLRQSRNAAIYAYLHTQLQPRNAHGTGAGGEGSKKEGSTPSPTPPGPTPDPKPTVYDMTWYLIHDKDSWDEAYNVEGSPLKKYYEDHPEEDLWNVDEKRAVNFNDRWYTGTIDGEEVSCGTVWATEKSQKLSIPGKTYYCEIWGYTLDPKTVDLFSDPDLTQPLNMTFEIATVIFDPETCKHCWEGAINAPDAKYPWAVVDVKSPYDLSKYEGKIEFQYDGSNYYPWGENFRNFNGYGIASLPVEIGIDPIDAEHTETIDPSELTVNGYVKLS